MQKRTTLADREEIIDLKRGGSSYTAIALATGWAPETVRRIWRAYRDAGYAGIAIRHLGRSATGPLATFAPLVRYVALRLKRQHPYDGPDVILADMAVRPSITGQPLPSAVSLGRYFQQFGTRLLVPRAHLQLPGETARLTAAYAPHDVWELDFDEGLHLPPLGWINVLNVTDLATGLKIGSFVHDAGPPQARHLITWEQMREDLRDAFTIWGLPKAMRTDRDRRLVAPGDYPIPMLATLWFVGLGVEHDLIRRVTQNGQVERFHRTWEGRLLYPPPADLLAQFQEYVRYQLWRMNVVLPSRGRHCHRCPPLLVYPEARDNPRYYTRRDEPALFDMQRVYAYLAEGRWLRRTSGRGQFHFQNETLSVTVRHAREVVVATFDLQGQQFVFTPAHSDEVLLRFRPAWLSAEVITGTQGV